MLRLRFFESMTQTQIAERIGVSQMHVSRLLAKALARLRDQLSRKRRTASAPAAAALASPVALTRAWTSPVVGSQTSQVRSPTARRYQAPALMSGHS